jgi:hypothetical protein
MIAELFGRLGRHAIVEWVPKEDAMVGRLLASRRDVFPDYTEAGFKAAFDGPFERVSRAPIAGTARTLYHFQRREAG